MMYAESEITEDIVSHVRENIRLRKMRVPLKTRISQMRFVDTYINGLKERNRKLELEKRMEEDYIRSKRMRNQNRAVAVDPREIRQALDISSDSEDSDSFYSSDTEPEPEEEDASDSDELLIDIEEAHAELERQNIKTQLVDQHGNIIKQVECYHCGWGRLKYYFRHPNARVFVAVFIVLCNFLLYAEGGFLLLFSCFFSLPKYYCSGGREGLYTAPHHF